MVLFFPSQQDLDCISGNGQILGKIKYDGTKNEYAFFPDNEATTVSEVEISIVAERIAGLYSGKYSLAMQDDD